MLPYTLLFLDVPTSAARCLHDRNDARDPSGKRWNCVGENYSVILLKWQFPLHLGIFYMPQIYDMRPTALLPFRRKACWGFFRPEKSRQLRPGLNPRTWVLKGSMLPLDHRSRLWCLFTASVNKALSWWCYEIMKSVSYKTSSPDTCKNKHIHTWEMPVCSTYTWMIYKRLRHFPL